MSVYDNIELPKNDGLYFKFEDKVENIVRLLSDPIVFTSEFKGQENTKYAYLVYNTLNKTVQVMNIPRKALQQIIDLARDPEYGDPTKYNLKITRTGEGFQTEYKIIASPNKSDTPADVLEAASKIDPIGVIGKGNGVSDVQWLADAQDGQKPRSEQPAAVGGSEDVADEGAPEDEPW